MGVKTARIRQDSKKNLFNGSREIAEDILRAGHSKKDAIRYVYKYIRGVIEGIEEYK